MKEIHISVFLFLFAGFVSAKEVEKNISFKVAKNYYQQAAISDNAFSLVYEGKSQANTCNSRLVIEE
ncbi:hypothetical protein BH11BAC1_BH11BAC1_10890 [soil metagenome]